MKIGRSGNPGFYYCSDTVTQCHSATASRVCYASFMSVQSFEDLYVFQKARALVKTIHIVSKTWTDRSLQDQIRRASVSVVSNIAEGFERGSKEEFIHFLYIARGSCGEVRAQLYVALDQAFISQDQFSLASDQADHTSRLLAKFIDGYKAKGHKGQKFVTPKDKDAEEFEAELKRLSGR